MDVYRAKTAGFCMGVSLALQKLDAALQDADGSEARLCTLGPIIHNPQVLRDYEKKGVVCVHSPAELQRSDVVVIRAHGISRHMESQVRQRGVRVVDATCPKVKKAQVAIARATAHKAALLLFGEAEHPEVQGLLSYAEAAARVFGSQDELHTLCLEPQSAYVLASQTTQDKNLFSSIENALREKLHNLTVLSTICDATRQRQVEAQTIASQVEAMVVIGGRQSGNTRRLADVAALSGIPTYHVESVAELDKGNFFQKKRVGLTAGASTPKSLIDATEAWLRSL